MSVIIGGTRSRSAGVISAITKQLKLMNLKPVKKIEVQFDPFHEKAETARSILYHISSPRVLNTNLNCLLKSNVVCDRSEPLIHIHLNDSNKILYKLNNLSALEVLQSINKHISSKVPVEEPATVPKQTKQSKRKRK